MQDEVERLAIELYQRDAMMILAYEHVEDSWANDRESVRQRYRELAKQNLAHPLVKQAQHRLSRLKRE